jgi:hypothetical protein
MDAHEHTLLMLYLTHDKGEMLFPIASIDKMAKLKCAFYSWNPGRSCAAN